MQDMTEAHIIKLKNAVMNFDWTYIFEENCDVNNLWNRIYKDVVSLLDLYCPIKTIKISKDRPDYITDEIIEFVI